MTSKTVKAQIVTE